MRYVAIVALVCSACTHVQGPYVRSIDIHGREIVVQRCPIEISGDEARTATEACTTKVLVIPDPVLAP